jgi:hypothetical protein
MFFLLTTMRPHLRSTERNVCLWHDWDKIQRDTRDEDERLKAEGSNMGVVLPNWRAEASLAISSRDDPFHDEHDYGRRSSSPDMGGGDFEQLSDASLVAWVALRPRVQEGKYPWLLRREEQGKPVVTVAVAGQSMTEVLSKLINSTKDTRARMCIPDYDPKNPRHAERANEIMRRRDRNHEHFIIYNSQSPSELYRHSWYMPHDPDNVDVNVEKLGVAREGDVVTQVQHWD